MKNVFKISIFALSLTMLSFTIMPVKEGVSIISTALAKITWKAQTLKLGNVAHNKPKSMSFEFKNTGTTSITITNVKGSCGCTATDYTKTSIKPGKSGKISAIFNAATKGTFSKTITVTTTASDKPTVLFFEGTVL